MNNNNNNELVTTTMTMVDNSSSFVDHEEFMTEGLRVLAFERNPVCLKLITALLQKCNYQVTGLNDLEEAMKILKQNKEKFDIVLTNVCDNGFKLLEVGKEQGISVILMSASEDVEVIKQSVHQGADDYLIKPIGLPKVKTLWTHVFRRRSQKLANNNNNNNNNNNGGSVVVQKDKRKKTKSNNRRIDDDDDGGGGGGVLPSEEKKRVRWDESLHDKFLDAIERLGGEEKAVPNKILEMMGGTIEGMTREKVASHLQKYRKSLKKINNGNNNNKGNRNNNNNGKVVHNVPSAFIGTRNVNVAPEFSQSMNNNNNNNNQWMVNHHQIMCHHQQPQPQPQPQPQQLEFMRQNHHHHVMVMQQPTIIMQQQRLGKEFAGANHHQWHQLKQQPQQQQQQQQPYGQFGMLHPDSFNLSGNQAMSNNGLFDMMKTENVTANELLLDEELQSILNGF